MSDTDPLDLNTIEARAAAATVGPWATFNRFHIEAPSVDRNVTQAAEWESSGIEREEDAEFIAHARTDIPALIAEVRRLREEKTAHEEAGCYSW
ncbi:hypothetical protein [Rathayibacter sp. AY2B9]|uniref:hypothetical protein n=1 Tax=Rathayibacter sp. AY2B9 TaxID=2080572 RepID=UPI000CE79903|nr:hypothetical protein [Rathayibacter sp. AY2B9]PPG34494.1 hypothetical protein C5C25_00285 [Rathayibacter sp. AY2B9]